MCWTWYLGPRLLHVLLRSLSRYRSLCETVQHSLVLSRLEVSLWRLKFHTNYYISWCVVVVILWLNWPCLSVCECVCEMPVCDCCDIYDSVNDDKCTYVIASLLIFTESSRICQYFLLGCKLELFVCVRKLCQTLDMFIACVFTCIFFSNSKLKLLRGLKIVWSSFGFMESS